MLAPIAAIKDAQITHRSAPAHVDEDSGSESGEIVPSQQQA